MIQYPKFDILSVSWSLRPPFTLAFQLLLLFCYQVSFVKIEYINLIDKIPYCFYIIQIYLGELFYNIDKFYFLSLIYLKLPMNNFTSRPILYYLKPIFKNILNTVYVLWENHLFTWERNK